LHRIKNLIPFIVAKAAFKDGKNTHIKKVPIKVNVDEAYDGTAFGLFFELYFGE